MSTNIDWQDLEIEVRSRDINGLSISNGQHLIDSECMVIGHVSTPIGGEPSWVFYNKPSYRASESLTKNAIPIDSTSFFEYLFQSATTLAPPFKTSSELIRLLERLGTLEND